MGAFSGSLGSLWVEVGARISNFEGAMDDVSQRINSAASDAEAKFAAFGRIGQQLVGVGAGLSAAVTLPLVGIGTAAVQLSEQLNIATLAFTTMLGSGEAAAGFLSELQAFAAQTPFEFPELVEASKRMLAMGFAAEDVLPSLRSIGDAAAALGGGTDTINGLTRALGQMAAKGKVSAEEMNQLAERGIPAWELLSKQIGVSIPEAMKLAAKGAISASTAIPAILQGMNDKFGGQMAQVSQTLTGVWSNFQDQISFVLADIGQTLAPALMSLLQAALPVLEWAKEAAHWFALLPEPIKNGAVAMVALVTTMGPVVAGIGGLLAVGASLATTFAPLFAAGGLFAGMAATFAGVALAIPLVTAALVAVGTWVYANWDGVSAVVVQAWDGIAELWGAVWNPVKTWLIGVWTSIATVVAEIWEPIGGFFSTIWQHIGPYFSQAWGGILGILSSVWNSIKTTAATVWGGIVSVFKTFLEWAAKIPGAAKLMNLDDAWRSAKKATSELDKAATSTAKIATSAKDAAGTKSAPLPKLGVSLKNIADESKTTTAEVNKGTTAHKEHTDKVKARLFSDNELITKIKEQKQAEADLGQELSRLTAIMAAYPGGVQPMIQANRELDQTIQDIYSSSSEFATVSIPQTQAAIDAAGASMRQLEGNFSQLGVTSQGSLDATALKATEAYNSIKASGLASARDIDLAWAAAEKARLDAARAAGEEIPAAQLRTLTEMERQLGVSTENQKSAWSGLTTQVSTIITNFAQDISKSLWEGGTSWGEKGKALLSSLGQAVSSAFIEPATTAISNFISGAIADLLGGKGLGGLSAKISDIGSSLSGLVGRGGGAAGAAGGVPGVGGGAGGAAGAVGGAGLAGIVGAVGSVASAVTGVIGVFQNAKQESSLNAIEENTRFSSLRILSLLENSNAYFPKVAELRGDFSTFLTAFASLMTTTEEARDHVRNNLAGIKASAASTVDHLLGLHATSQSSLMSGREATSHLAMIRDLLSMGANRPNVTINISGTATAADGESVMAALRAQAVI